MLGFCSFGEFSFFFPFLFILILKIYYYFSTFIPMFAFPTVQNVIFYFLCLLGQSVVLDFCWTVLTLLMGIYVYVYTPLLLFA